ncbi:MAG: thioredoxin [Chitinophagaceae bacterium]|nr:thioredoxin [Chitinophagaceae bacterium]
MDAKKNYGWFTWSNSIMTLLVVFIIMMIVFPEVKANVIMGFMKIGLFKPDIPPATSRATGKDFPLAPDITFTNAKDSSLSLVSLKGKVIFMNFWAVWCPPCMAEMPGINKLFNRVSQDSNIVFIITDVDGDFNKSGKFMVYHNYQLPLFKTAGSIPGIVFSGTLPTTLVIDKKGKIVFREQGIANYETKRFEDFLKQLAAE